MYTTPVASMPEWWNDDEEIFDEEDLDTEIAYAAVIELKMTLVPKHI